MKSLKIISIVFLLMLLKSHVDAAFLPINYSNCLSYRNLFEPISVNGSNRNFILRTIVTWNISYFKCNQEMIYNQIPVKLNDFIQSNYSSIRIESLTGGFICNEFSLQYGYSVTYQDFFINEKYLNRIDYVQFLHYNLCWSIEKFDMNKTLVMKSILMPRRLTLYNYNYYYYISNFFLMYNHQSLCENYMSLRSNSDFQKEAQQAQSGNVKNYYKLYDLNGTYQNHLVFEIDHMNIEYFYTVYTLDKNCSINSYTLSYDPEKYRYKIVSGYLKGERLSFNISHNVYRVHFYGLLQTNLNMTTYLQRLKNSTDFSLKIFAYSFESYYLDTNFININNITMLTDSEFSVYGFIDLYTFSPFKLTTFTLKLYSQYSFFSYILNEDYYQSLLNGNIFKSYKLKHQIKPKELKEVKFVSNFENLNCQFYSKRRLTGEYLYLNYYKVENCTLFLISDELQSDFLINIRIQSELTREELIILLYFEVISSNSSVSNVNPPYFYYEFQNFPPLSNLNYTLQTEYQFELFSYSQFERIHFYEQDSNAVVIKNSSQLVEIEKNSFKQAFSLNLVDKKINMIKLCYYAVDIYNRSTNIICFKAFNNVTLVQLKSIEYYPKFFRFQMDKQFKILPNCRIDLFKNSEEKLSYYGYDLANIIMQNTGNNSFDISNSETYFNFTKEINQIGFYINRNCFSSNDTNELVNQPVRFNLSYSQFIQFESVAKENYSILVNISTGVNNTIIKNCSLGIWFTNKTKETYLIECTNRTLKINQYLLDDSNVNIIYLVIEYLYKGFLVSETFIIKNLLHVSDNANVYAIHNNNYSIKYYVYTSYQLYELSYDRKYISFVCENIFLEIVFNNSLTIRLDSLKYCNRECYDSSCRYYYHYFRPEWFIQNPKLEEFFQKDCNFTFRLKSENAFHVSYNIFEKNYTFYKIFDKFNDLKVKLHHTEITDYFYESKITQLFPAYGVSLQHFDCSKLNIKQAEYLCNARIYSVNDNRQVQLRIQIDYGEILLNNSVLYLNDSCNRYIDNGVLVDLIKTKFFEYSSFSFSYEFFDEKIYNFNLCYFFIYGKIYIYDLDLVLNVKFYFDNYYPNYLYDNNFEFYYLKDLSNVSLNENLTLNIREYYIYKKYQYNFQKLFIYDQENNTQIIEMVGFSNNTAVFSVPSLNWNTTYFWYMNSIFYSWRKFQNRTSRIFKLTTQNYPTLLYKNKLQNLILFDNSNKEYELNITWNYFNVSIFFFNLTAKRLQKIFKA